ncbi:hypothetical protein [Nitratireductor sp. ZSWI3]|uniref:COG3904 family protein n=1 Tax=Nitratireductor sp. ZSWI3 TaxID=2966359 RepID=UPI0021502F0D|nr:hypothetical protein [Nitratireductor sp. ZSWI3]MCR4268138.1 hypothetical protein [Nitratireductor sp. ZSWI3]
MSGRLASVFPQWDARALMHRLGRLLEGPLTEAAMIGALIGTMVVLGMNLRELAYRHAGPSPDAMIVEPGVAARPRAAATITPPVRFAVRPGGVLAVDGMIDQGAAARFRTMLDALRGEVSTVTLDSPGGALGDAMAMARLIRRHGLATRVDDGAICASSCPLVLAGGVERQAGERALIGVHQFHAVRTAASPAQAMADAQLVTARITRHLSEMGVDPALWLHALDTPPHDLYGLTQPEMLRYRLITASPPQDAGS